MTDIFIKNAALPTGKKGNIDLLVQNGVITSISPTGTTKVPTKARMIDAEGALILPGLCDLHAHIGRQGYTAKATTEATMKGGITAIRPMPDSSVKPETPITLIPTDFITKKGQGEELVGYHSLNKKGITTITDPAPPKDVLLLHRAMQYSSPLNLTFALKGDTHALTAQSTMHPSPTSYILGLTGAPACAEEIGIETLVRLAKDTQAMLHVQTVSTAESANIIRREKAHGAKKLSAEVALHHLIFTHENVGDYDTTFKTSPPLRDEADKAGLISALKDGTIDCIVTQHCPVSPFDKKQDFIIAPPGMLGMETFLPSLYHHLVKPGLLTWHNIITVCSDNPRRLAGLSPITIKEKAPANFVLFSTEEKTTVTKEFLCGTAENAPFMGQSLYGKVLHTIVGTYCM